MRTSRPNAYVASGIYANALGSRLGDALKATPGVTPQDASTPARLHSYPDGKIGKIVSAYSDTLHVVFLWSVPVAVVAFGFLGELRFVAGMAEPQSVHPHAPNIQMTTIG